MFILLNHSFGHFNTFHVSKSQKFTTTIWFEYIIKFLPMSLHAQSQKCHCQHPFSFPQLFFNFYLTFYLSNLLPPLLNHPCLFYHPSSIKSCTLAMSPHPWLRRLLFGDIECFKLKLPRKYHKMLKLKSLTFEFEKP